MPGIGMSAAAEDTLTIAPPPTARRCGAASRMATSGARRLTAITRSNRLVGIERSPTNVIAALLTTRSRRPKWSTVRATIATTSCSTARLVGTAMASPPDATIVATVSSMVPGSRSGCAAVARAAHATRHPACASAIAVAAPTPRLAPVTSATRPVRSRSRSTARAGDTRCPTRARRPRRGHARCRRGCRARPQPRVRAAPLRSSPRAW
jgi:hypothetical protein